MPTSRAHNAAHSAADGASRPCSAKSMSDGVDVHGVRHDLRRYEGVDELLDDDGAHKRRRAPAQELTNMPATAARAPPSQGPTTGMMLRMPVMTAERRRSWECSITANSDDAGKPDDAALDEGSLDVAAHDPGEGEMQHGGGLLVPGAGQASALAAQGRQLHEDPERDDQGEADGHESVGNTGSEGHHARRPRTRRNPTPSSERLAKALFIHRWISSLDSRSA